METRHGDLAANGLRLHYTEWGRVDAPPIVLLHGLRSYGATWEPVAERLASKFRLIALDQRGRGDSDWSPGADYYTDAYVSDLEQAMDALALARFVLIGHSMGGTNTYVYAARHPLRVRAAIIEDIGPGSSTATEGAERIVAELRKTPESFASWEEARTFWRSQRPMISEAALDSRVKYSLKPGRNGRVEWKHDHHGIATARMNTDPERYPDLWPYVRVLACPTLVIRGARSDFLPVQTAQAMVGANPRIRFTEVAGASHYVHDDNFEGFMQALEPFLDSLPA